MRGSSTDHWRCNARPDRPWQGSALPVALALFAQLSTRRLPPRLLERLRVAASQLSQRQGAVAAAAIGRFLIEDGF